MRGLLRGWGVRRGLRMQNRFSAALRCGSAVTAIAIAAMTATAAHAQASAATTAAPPAAGNPPSTNPQTDVNNAAAVKNAALQPVAAQNGVGQEIVVTGTRITGITNANSASPISVTTAAQIQETKATSVEEVLQKMTGPDANAISNQSNNGGVGISNISLRDLGPQRALVLVDGTRLIPNGSVPDINGIPISMIERIDVLRDSASSVYGADAIGGVVNIVLKHKSDGFHFEAGGSRTQHGGGGSYNIGGTWGASNDRGSILVGASWDHKDAIPGFKRDWAIDPNLCTATSGCSSYRSQLDALQLVSSTDGSDLTLKQNTVINGVVVPAGTIITNLVATGGKFYTTKNCALTAVLPNTACINGTVKLNANGSPQFPYNTLAGSLDRKSLDLSATYDLTDGLAIFMDGFYSKRTSQQTLRS